MSKKSAVLGLSERAGQCMNVAGGAGFHMRGNSGETCVKALESGSKGGGQRKIDWLK